VGEILRKDIDALYKWRLEDIYESEEIWESEFAQLEGLLVDITKFKGKLKSRKGLLDYFKMYDRINYLFGRVYVYSNMRLHEDSSISHYQELTMRASNMMSKLSQAVSFFTPELSALPKETLDKFLADPEFEPYNLTIKDVIRNKKFILSHKEEALLSKVSAFGGGFKDIFEMVNSLELDLPETTWLDGTKRKLTHGSYSLLQSTCKDQNIRREAFHNYMGAYKKLLNTITLMYSGNVKKNWFYAKTRGHKSCLSSALNGSNVPESVYNNLVASVDANVKYMHRFLHLRKRLLGLEKMHGYDTAIPMIEGVELKMPYDEAYDLVVKSLEPLGDEYVSVVKQAKTGGWIDVYENVGKRPGAYQWGPYGTHPYILLNYKETTRDIFTITHELGHALHSYYSDNAQPISKHSYEIFVAEVASTVNEILLIRHLLSTTTDAGLKKYLLSYLIETFRSTLFTQTMFATFELEAHTLVEKDKPISEKALSEIYTRLVKKYNGDAVEFDEESAFGWARIPHFYRAFYVYQYATGIISAVSIADAILKDADDVKSGKAKTNKALERFKKFLATGGSDYPVELLKNAGVDLTKKAPFDAAFKVLKEAVEELEKLCE